MGAQREMKSEKRVKELEGELQEAVQELEVSRASAASLLQVRVAHSTSS